MSDTTGRTVNENRFPFFKFSWVISACKAVTPAMGTHAISGKYTLSGIITQLFAGTQVYATKEPPLSVSPNTLFLIFKCGTLFPTCPTIKAKSAPRILFLGLNKPKEKCAKRGLYTKKVPINGIRMHFGENVTLFQCGFYHFFKLKDIRSAIACSCKSFHYLIWIKTF